MLRLNNRGRASVAGTDAAGPTGPADHGGAASGGGGWLLLAAAVAAFCCAGPGLLAGVGVGLVAGALGSWLRLGAIVTVLLGLLAGAVAVVAHRRRRCSTTTGSPSVQAEQLRAGGQRPGERHAEVVTGVAEKGEQHRRGAGRANAAPELVPIATPLALPAADAAARARRQR